MAVATTLCDMTSDNTDIDQFDIEDLEDDTVSAMDSNGELVTMDSSDFAELLRRFSAVEIIMKNAAEMVDSLADSEHAQTVQGYYTGLFDGFKFLMTGQLPGQED